MSFHRRVAAVFTVLLCAISSPRTAAAQGTAPPTFAGTWVLDTSKSSGLNGLSALKLRIAVSGDTITVDTDAQTVMGPQTSHSTVGVDGKPWKNSMTGPAGSITLSTIAKRVGSNLALDAAGELQGYQLTQHDEWSLDKTGRTLTINRTTDVATQHIAATLVLVRE
jgi:hypothetical protein